LTLIAQKPDRSPLNLCRPRRIPPELQARQANIPCSQIIGIGNVLRHEHHRVSDALIWSVIQQHFPPLKIAIAAIEAELKKQ